MRRSPASFSRMWRIPACIKIAPYACLRPTTYTHVPLTRPWISKTMGNLWENWFGLLYGNVPFNFSTSHIFLHHRCASLHVYVAHEDMLACMLQNLLQIYAVYNLSLTECAYISRESKHHGICTCKDMRVRLHVIHTHTRMLTFASCTG